MGGMYSLRHCLIWVAAKYNMSGKDLEITFACDNST